MRIYFSCLFALVAFTACQSVKLDATAPPGFDLTGTWKLNTRLSDPPPIKGAGKGEGAKKGKRQNKPKPEIGRRGNKRNAQARPLMVNTPMAFITRDFPVLASRKMQIEQNHDSLGVNYDRGGYRDVSWGQRDRGYWQVTAGWEDGVFIIHSKSSDQIVFERHLLSSDGKVLTVNLTYHDPVVDLKLTRVFDRASQNFSK